MKVYPGRAGDQMAEVARRISGDLAEFCSLLIQADVNQEWLGEGAPTIAQWLSARFGFEEAFGRRLVRVAKRLVDLPELSKRFATGELSLDAVELLSEVATPDTEIDLIDQTGDADLPDIARLVSRAKPPSNEESKATRSADWAYTQWNLQGSQMDINGRLSGVGALMVEERLVETAKQIPDNPDQGAFEDWGTKMAAALVEVCATDAEGNGSVPVLNVHAELDALTDPEDGAGVSEMGRGPVVANETARMLGCDGDIETTIEQQGKPIGIGRKSRKIAGWLRRQVEARDHHCQFPGGRPNHVPPGASHPALGRRRTHRPGQSGPRLLVAPLVDPREWLAYHPRSQWQRHLSQTRLDPPPTAIYLGADGPRPKTINQNPSTDTSAEPYSFTHHWSG